jgi:hypothetical protein
MVQNLQEADRSRTNDLSAMKFGYTRIMMVARFLDLVQGYGRSERATYLPIHQRNSGR